MQAFLAGHSEDRVAANQRYRIAEEVLNRVGDESTRVGNEWPRLLDQVRGAQADLDHSEQLAREDVRLARQAEAEITDGARSIRQARTYFSMGVTLNTAGAESLLNQAEQFYHSQNYEQAIRTAGAAVQQVRQAHQQAVQQAHVRQMQIQADQRRRRRRIERFRHGGCNRSCGGDVPPGDFGGVGRLLGIRIGWSSLAGAAGGRRVRLVVVFVVERDERVELVNPNRRNSVFTIGSSRIRGNQDGRRLRYFQS